MRFDHPTRIGAILQVVGDHAYVFRNAPRSCVWEGSTDGSRWEPIESTRTIHERRLFRLHRLTSPRMWSNLRLRIDSAEGAAPVVREAEFFPDPQTVVAFPDWSVVVNTTDQPRLPGEGKEFIPLAQSCSGWGHLQAQQVWLGDFDEEFIAMEPRPLCVFLSGNFKDWCEVPRRPWRGVQEVMRKGHIPMWGACGGAQGLAILAEVGVDRPWDCPHCRDPKSPKSPIYGHIGHTARKPCGDYSGCIFERGPTHVKAVRPDPIWEGLPPEFLVMESHCGQIEWPPRGWELIGMGGQGAKTKSQCLRRKDRYIYAAQFHIEMEGTPGNSRTIMGNFLYLAKQWGGWNPHGKVQDH